MTGGVRAYARHRGCSHASVQRALSRGRIHGRQRDGRIVIDFDEADRAWEENRSKLPPASTAAPVAAAASVSIPLEHFSLFRINRQLVLAVSTPDHEGEAVLVPIQDDTGTEIALRLLRETMPPWYACLTEHFGATESQPDDE